MSYYSNPKNICPGPIEGSPLDGLRTRAAISVKRVLDSCCKQLSLENTRLEIECEEKLPTPFTFMAAASTQIAAMVTDLRVTRLDERPCFARIQCNVTVPLRVTFRDACGDEHTKDSQIKIAQDIVMYIPEASVFPFQVEAVASCNGLNGRHITQTGGVHEFMVTACLTVITKIIAETDLLIPVYGFCPSPRAVEYESEVCNKFFELPLYPSGR